MSNAMKVQPVTTPVQVPRVALVATVGGLAAVAAHVPSPGDLLAGFSALWQSTAATSTPAASSSSQIDQLLLSGSGVLVWSAVLWVAVVSVVGIWVAVVRRDLSAGSLAMARLLPRAARGLVIAAIGGSALAAASGCAPAGAGGLVGPTHAAAGLSQAAGGFGVEFDLDWPLARTPAAALGPAATTSAAPTVAPTLAETPPAGTPAPAPERAPGPPAAPTPAQAPAAATAPAPPASRSHESTVIVRPGDSLWSIAAAHLPAGSTDADVALAWPHWFSANHDLIGNDPDRIRPGWALVVPDISVLPVSALEEPS